MNGVPSFFNGLMKDLTAPLTYWADDMQNLKLILASVNR